MNRPSVEILSLESLVAQQFQQEPNIVIGSKDEDFNQEELKESEFQTTSKNKEAESKEFQEEENKIAEPRIEFE